MTPREQRRIDALVLGSLRTTTKHGSSDWATVGEVTKTYRTYYDYGQIPARNAYDQIEQQQRDHLDMIYAALCRLTDTGDAIYDIPRHLWRPAT